MNGFKLRVKRWMVTNSKDVLVARRKSDTLGFLNLPPHLFISWASNVNCDIYDIQFLPSHNGSLTFFTGNRMSASIRILRLCNTFPNVLVWVKPLVKTRNKRDGCCEARLHCVLMNYTPLFWRRT